MQHPDIQPLLILQERDRVVDQIKGVLDQLPREKARLESKGETARENVRVAKVRLHELESQRKAIEADLATLEQQEQRFRNQQLEVKKNEEYQALEHEIAGVKEKAAALEEKELEILYAIDEARQALSDREAELSTVEKEIALDCAALDERGKVHETDLLAAEKEADLARAKVPPVSLTVYQDLRPRHKLPIVVMMQEKRCLGCHLKVAGETEGKVRSGRELATCEHCGRILYYEP